MPVVAGDAATRRLIGLYVVFLIPATLAPGPWGWLPDFTPPPRWALESGSPSRSADSGSGDRKGARPLFFASIAYLFGIFLSLGLDRLLADLFG